MVFTTAKSASVYKKPVRSVIAAARHQKPEQGHGNISILYFNIQ
jgi:hypothetical protein